MITMESITLNTAKLKQKVEDIAKIKIFLESNKDKFSKYRYYDVQTLTMVLNKIYGTIEDLNDNINTICNILDGYYHDIESIERRFSEGEELVIKDLNVDF